MTRRQGVGRWREDRPRRAALDFLRRWYGLEEMHRHMALIELPLDAEDDDVEEGTYD